MKKTISLPSFVSAFTEMGRYDQFSLEGLKVIYKYITGYESESGQEIELDVVGLCCDFAEGTAKDIARDYSIDLSALEGASEDEANFLDALTAIVREYLDNEGVLIGETDTTFVYRQF